MNEDGRLESCLQFLLERHPGLATSRNARDRRLEPYRQSSFEKLIAPANIQTKNVVRKIITYKGPLKRTMSNNLQLQAE